MRQIYNTADESPEMVIFQLSDMVPSVGNSCILTSTTQAVVCQTQPIESPPSSGQSSFKNPSRLSLANLLPSRLALNLKNFHFFLFI